MTSVGIGLDIFVEGVAVSNGFRVTEYAYSTNVISGFLQTLRVVTYIT